MTKASLLAVGFCAGFLTSIAIQSPAFAAQSPSPCVNLSGKYKASLGDFFSNLSIRWTQQGCASFTITDLTPGDDAEVIPPFKTDGVSRAGDPESCESEVWSFAWNYLTHTCTIASSKADSICKVGEKYQLTETYSLADTIGDGSPANLLIQSTETCGVVQMSRNSQVWTAQP